MSEAISGFWLVPIPHIALLMRATCRAVIVADVVCVSEGLFR
jgi:hypothetical protein